MAVAFDAVGPGASSANSTAALSYSHAAVSSTSVAVMVALAVGMSVGNAASGWTLSITYGGTAMTEIKRLDSGNAGNTGFIALFGLLLAGTLTGTQTVVASATKSGVTPTSLISDSVTYSGVASWGTPVFGVNATTGAAPSSTVSSATGRMVHNAMCAGAAVSGDTQTRRYLLNLNTNSRAGNMVMSDAAGAASVTFTATANADWWGWIGVDLTAAATAAPKPIRLETNPIRRASFY